MLSEEPRLPSLLFLFSHASWNSKHLFLCRNFFGRPCDSRLFIVAEHNLISQESALFYFCFNRISTLLNAQQYLYYVEKLCSMLAHAGEAALCLL